MTRDFNREAESRSPLRLHGNGKLASTRFFCAWSRSRRRRRSRALSLRVNSVVVRGPMVEAQFVKRRNYERFFPKAVPATEAARRAYAGELLRAVCDESVSASGG